MDDYIKTDDFNFTIKDSQIVFDKNIEVLATKNKMVSEMETLLYDSSNIDEKQWQYCFAFGLTENKEVQNLREKYQLYDGITVLNKGTVNGECRKNSGHYHLLLEGHDVPAFEIYECIYGKAAVVLQESHDFMNSEDYKVDSFRIVILEKGQKVIVPPYCGHCVLNIGDDLMAFYNFSGVYKVDYKPIENRKGFGYYLLKNGNMFTTVPNKNYKDLPLVEIVIPKEDKSLGIDFNKSVYTTFLENPKIYEYLTNPDEYIERVERLLK